MQVFFFFFFFNFCLAHSHDANHWALFKHPKPLSLIGSLSLAEHLVRYEPMNLIVITMPEPTNLLGHSP